MLVDTHAHLNFPELVGQLDEVLGRAEAAGVKKIICVGTQASDSQAAVELADKYSAIYATVGLHPHDAEHARGDIDKISALIGKPEVVAIGECGLDYSRSGDKKNQEQIFRSQIELAIAKKVPLVFHVRDAFQDFFRIIDDYHGLTGVVHSFSSHRNDLDEVLTRGFYVALNGIMTFSKEEDQLAAAKAVPLDRLLLETDAPFLTPTPNRGKVNEPAYVKRIADFLCELRQEPPAELAAATTNNAQTLFKL